MLACTHVCMYVQLNGASMAPCALHTQTVTVTVTVTMTIMIIMMMMNHSKRPPPVAHTVPVRCTLKTSLLVTTTHEGYLVINER
jgi:hypothetical protein